jgi:hypothetical protein
MSDFREMADVVFMWHQSKTESEAKVIRMEIQKPRTHTENAEFFFDHNAMSCGEIIPRERKPICSPVFELPYGADAVANINDAEHYR